MYETWSKASSPMLRCGVKFWRCGWNGLEMEVTLGGKHGGCGWTEVVYEA